MQYWYRTTNKQGRSQPTSTWPRDKPTKTPRNPVQNVARYLLNKKQKLCKPNLTPKLNLSEPLPLNPSLTDSAAEAADEERGGGAADTGTEETIRGTTLPLRPPPEGDEDDHEQDRPSGSFPSDIKNQQQAQQSCAQRCAPNTLLAKAKVDTPSNVVVQRERGRGGQASLTEMGGASREGIREGDSGQLTGVLFPKFYNTEKGSRREAIDKRHEVFERPLRNFEKEDAWPVRCLTKYISEGLHANDGRRRRILQRKSSAATQVLSEIQRGLSHLRVKLPTHGLRRIHGGFSRIHAPLRTHVAGPIPARAIFRLRRRHTCELFRQKFTNGPKNIAPDKDGSRRTSAATQAEKDSLDPSAQGGVSWVYHRLRQNVNICATSEIEEGSEANKTNLGEGANGKAAPKAPSHNHRPVHGPVASLPGGQTAQPRPARTAGKHRVRQWLERRRTGHAQRAHKGGAAVVSNISHLPKKKAARKQVQMPRAVDSGNGRERAYNRWSSFNSEGATSLREAALQKREGPPHQHEGNDGGASRREDILQSSEREPSQHSIRLDVCDTRNKQMGLQTEVFDSHARRALSLVTSHQHEDDRDSHQHEGELLRRRPLSGETNRPEGKGGNATVSERNTQRTEKGPPLGTGANGEGKGVHVAAPPTEGKLDAHEHDSLRAPAELDISVDSSSRTEPVLLPRSQQDTKSPRGDRKATTRSSCNIALVAQRPLVSSGSSPGGKQAGGVAEGHGHSHKSAESVIPFLGLDWSKAVRKAEDQNGVPEAARLTGRLTERTERLYAKGWHGLSELLKKDDVRSKFLAARGASEALALLTAMRSTELAGLQRSIASLNNTKNAVTHFLEAWQPTPASILRNTSKRYARLHPSQPRNATVPDYHAMLERVSLMAAKTDLKTVRLRAMLLMALLTGRRASDIVRVWRHARSLRFECKRVDAPGWATTVSSGAADTLLELKLLRNKPSPREFIVMSFRAYRPKTSGPRNRIYATWVPLMENKFDVRLCPVDAVANYLKATADLQLPKQLKYDKHFTVEELVDDGGRNPIRASPLFVSISRPIKGLQSNTFAGMIDRTLLSPAKLDNTPHVLRATVSSYMKAYGVPLERIMSIADWASESTFFKHYYRNAIAPVDPTRIADARFPDWKLTRAHVLTKGPLPNISPVANDTSSDAALARVLSNRQQSRRTINTRLRRKDHH